jgi:hypothetical protein
MGDSNMNFNYSFVFFCLQNSRPSSKDYNLFHIVNVLFLL